MSGFNISRWAIGLIVCLATACASHASPVTQNDKADSPHSGAPKSAATSDLVSVHLGTHQLLIPRAYFGIGAFSVQTTNHLVLDIHVPDIRPLTTDERDRLYKSWSGVQNRVHVILESNVPYTFGKGISEVRIRNSPSNSPSSSFLTPVQSEIPSMIVYRNTYWRQDIYIVKGSSPKFFFECDSYNKFFVRYTCKYHDQFVGETTMQLWYDKSRINDIVDLTPKIKALLLSFVVH